MQIEEPFFKVYIAAEGVKYRVSVNGADVQKDKSKHPHQLEIPINQFVRTGKNHFAVQLDPLTREGNITATVDSYIFAEFRLYLNLNDYVVLNTLRYSAKGAAAGNPLEGSSAPEAYYLVNNKFEAQESGDYVIHKLEYNVDENTYNQTDFNQIVEIPTPFPEWKFLKGDEIPNPRQFKTADTMINNLVGAPFSVLEEIHASLSRKDLDAIMHLFKERNEEMDKAFYYKPGTYEKMLRDAFQEEFDKGMILNPLDIQYAKPYVSYGKNLLSLGADSLIRFHNESKSVFNTYDILFRKEGDKWIITR